MMMRPNRLRAEFAPMVDLVPANQQGVAKIDHFEVSEAEASFSELRQIATQGRAQAVRPGKYARLLVNGQLYMTDTQMEKDTNAGLLSNAKGNVLIAGLGLGMVLVPLLKNPKINTILVVEKFKDVIDLVAPSFKEAIDDDRLHIFNEDIHTWRPETDWSWDTIYFDIWPDLCRDNLKEMYQLEKGFEPNLAPSGWMESWSKCEMTDYDDEEEDDEDE